ncbi:uncharacterized protein [Nicotiana tomentosiformis]|uniref:uncharacterized protein n=1 Tax=Nicotiana tomentosiformis TaxID=4098 RepID=UPI00388CA3AE
MGTDLVCDALEKVKLVKKRHHTSQSKENSNVDMTARDVAFLVGEKFMLKVSPIKDLMRFGKKGKLSLWYIGPFEILERVGKVAYRLALPPNLSGFHLVFRISMLRKYYGDPSYVLNFRSVQLVKDLTYVEELVAIFDKKVRKLRSNKIASVKV